LSLSFQISLYGCDFLAGKHLDLLQPDEPPWTGNDMDTRADDLAEPYRGRPAREVHNDQRSGERRLLAFIERKEARRAA
jgi:hypothetical protein